MFFILWIVIILTFFSVIMASTKVKIPSRFTGAVSDDGHVVSRDNDLTCETVYGHQHEHAEPRYIVHEDPDEGFVILNGVKRSLEECKYL